MIQESVYARAFARALLGIAQDRSDVDRVAQDARALEEQWQASAELRRFCCSRHAGSLFLRQGLGRQLWGNTFCETFLAFLDRLAERGQLRLLPQIAASFRTLADKSAGRRHVEATFACEPQAPELARVRQMVTDAYGPLFTFTQRVAPELLAGVRIRIDDRLVDASLAGRLARLKHGLLKPMRPETAAAGESQTSL